MSISSSRRPFDIYYRFSPAWLTSFSSSSIFLISSRLCYLLWFSSSSWLAIFATSSSFSLSKRVVLSSSALIWALYSLIYYSCDSIIWSFSKSACSSWISAASSVRFCSIKFAIKSLLDSVAPRLIKPPFSTIACSSEFCFSSYSFWAMASSSLFFRSCDDSKTCRQSSSIVSVKILAH